VLVRRSRCRRGWRGFGRRRLRWDRWPARKQRGLVDCVGSPGVEPNYGRRGAECGEWGAWWFGRSRRRRRARRMGRGGWSWGHTCLQRQIRRWRARRRWRQRRARWRRWPRCSREQHWHLVFARRSAHRAGDHLTGHPRPVRVGRGGRAQYVRLLTVSGPVELRLPGGTYAKKALSRFRYRCRVAFSPERPPCNERDRAQFHRRDHRV
jgi:hypothetical protein